MMAGAWARTRALVERLSPAPRTLRWARVAVACGAVAITAAAAHWGREIAFDNLRRHPYFRVAQVEIRGVGNLVSVAEVRRWAGVDVGDSLWDADPGRIRDRLESHPMLRSALVRRRFPDRLEIRVRERQPAAITVGDGLYYIDRTGERFGPLAASHGRDFPVFTGVPDKGDGRRRWALRRALHMLRRDGGDGLEISEIHLDPVEGLVLLPSSPRVPLYLGWHGWERRLQKGVRALRGFDGAAERLAGIDLRYRGQVVVKLRDVDPAPIDTARTAKIST